MSNTKATLPVVVSVYHRVEHFRQCIEALRLNTLAEGTRLVVCSDAAACPEHQNAVAAVRDYARSIEGFESVEVHEREQNVGAIRNSRMGIEHALTDCGSSIYMEDDIITAPGFLAFMNEAQGQYGDSPEVLSVTGYCPPIQIPDDYPYDAFMLPRFCAWGIAYSDENFRRVPDKLDRHQAMDDLKDRHFRRKLMAGGTDIADMLRLELAGRIDAYDVRAMYLQARCSMVSVYPRRSLVQNIGQDGSGINCGATDRFRVDLWNKVGGFHFPKAPFVDGRILKSNWKFRTPPLRKRMIKSLKRTDFYRKLRGRT